MMSSSTRSGFGSATASLSARSPLFATLVRCPSLSSPFMIVRFSGVSSTISTTGLVEKSSGSVMTVSLLG